jgi:hypothetical protein
MWTLTELPSEREEITSKWVFKTKFDFTGKVRTPKARLVA